MLNILSIGGSDPSSGAGIQSDIKSCESLGAYCLTAITGITSQNTSRFGTVEPVSTKILKQQLEMLLSDFKISAVKIGMVHSPGPIRVIFKSLKETSVPIVLDPVIKSTTGGMLITRQAVSDFKRYLIPISTIITPNKFEAEYLTGSKIKSKKSAEEAAKKLQKMGTKNVSITGLDMKQNQVTDYVLSGSHRYCLSQEKIPSVNHGSGCNYSLALCYALANKRSIKDAVVFSKKFTYESIKNSKKVGAGIRVVQSGSGDGIYDKLSSGIVEFMNIKYIHEHIPECQTNFVFSKTRPISTDDVLGVEGRIVRSGRELSVAGELKYGGSKHVASAVLAASKKFPSLRAAVNIRFQKKTVSKLKKSLIVLSYDRRTEPARVKDSEGSSIGWGIRAAIRSSKKPPDAVFHEGDFGKEPMIIVFGRTPAEIILKLQKCLA